MAYPPSVPPATRTDSTPQFTNHPADHNGISGALTDIINELGTNPSSAAATLTARLASYRLFGVSDTGVTRTTLTTTLQFVTAAAALPAGSGYYIAFLLLTIDPGNATAALPLYVESDIVASTGASVAQGFSTYSNGALDQVFCMDAASYNTATGVSSLRGRCRRSVLNATPGTVCDTTQGSHLIVATWTDT